MTTFSLHEVLGIEPERAEEMSAELHDALHDSNSMQAVSKKLSETYDPDALMMGTYLGLAIMMNNKRMVPQGYSVEITAVPNPDLPERPAEAPPYPPDRWICPECGAIVEEIIYVTLPRTTVQGEHGRHTEVTCPVCERQTISMLWRVVEVVGTEAVV